MNRAEQARKKNEEEKNEPTAVPSQTPNTNQSPFLLSPATSTLPPIGPKKPEKTR